MYKILPSQKTLATSHPGTEDIADLGRFYQKIEGGLSDSLQNHGVIRASPRTTPNRSCPRNVAVVEVIDML